MDKTVFLSTIPDHPSFAHRNQERHLETMRFEIPVKSSRSLETDAFMGGDNFNDVHTMSTDKSFSDISCSPSGSVYI